jgi:hypothetical protein
MTEQRTALLHSQGIFVADFLQPPDDFLLRRRAKRPPFAFAQRCLMKFTLSDVNLLDSIK